jgi:hypothetical protein
MPTLTVSGSPTYTGGGSPTVLDPTLTLTDPNSGAILSSAEVEISSGTYVEHEDKLSFTAEDGISGAFNSQERTVTLKPSKAKSKR